MIHKRKTWVTGALGACAFIAAVLVTFSTAGSTQADPIVIPLQTGKCKVRLKWDDAARTFHFLSIVNSGTYSKTRCSRTSYSGAWVNIAADHARRTALEIDTNGAKSGPHSGNYNQATQIAVVTVDQNTSVTRAATRDLIAMEPQQF